MYLEKKIQEKLKVLCQEVFKRPNLYKKLLKNGYLEPVNNVGAYRYKEQRWYTPEGLLEFLENLKKDIEKRREELEAAAKDGAPVPEAPKEKIKLNRKQRRQIRR